MLPSPTVAERTEAALAFGQKPAASLFPENVDAIFDGICPGCQSPVGEFRDEVSKREYGISGLCQSCQDEVFG